MPFDNHELKDADLFPKEWETLILKGFYPAIYDRQINHSVFYSNYIQTYIHRDITDLTKVHDVRRFISFIGLCATKVGQILNLNKLAKDCGISQPTAKAWLSILERSYIVFLLPPYFENFNKRIIKSPKLYFYDTGLASHLLGLRKNEDLTDESSIGNLFENLVVAELIKNNLHKNLLKNYWFWRNSQGIEVDILVKKGSFFYISEIKSTQTILPKLVKGLNYYEKISNGKVKNKTIIYGGNESYKRNDYVVTSWSDI